MKEVKPRRSNELRDRTERLEKHHSRWRNLIKVLGYQYSLRLRVSYFCHTTVSWEWMENNLCLFLQVSEQGELSPEPDT